MRNTVAVGVDGSEPSLIALRWALDTAMVRAAELLVIIAEPPRLDRSGVTARSTRLRNAEIQDHTAAIRRAIRKVIGDANGAAERGGTGKPDNGNNGAGNNGAEDSSTATFRVEGLTVRVEGFEGTPTEVLLSVSRRVDLLVVGGHGYGGWRDHFTTSVTGQLAIRTKAAVCVVRAFARPERNRIVVGYDPRSGAAAVDFAIAEATARGASALIVSTWQYPRDTRATSPEAAGILEQGAAAALHDLTTELRHAHPDVAIDTVVRFGYPVDVLAELAQSTDMVVIGSRKYGGFLNNGILNAGLLPGGLATLVVGSVAIGVLRRVSTPVVIVPHA